MKLPLFALPVLIALGFWLPMMALSQGTVEAYSPIFPADTPRPDMEVFVRPGCSHCAKAEMFLQLLQRENPLLSVVVHDVSQDPAAIDRLQALAKRLDVPSVRLPAFAVGGQLILGFADDLTTGRLLRDAMRQAASARPGQPSAADGCEVEASDACAAEPPGSVKPDTLAKAEFGFFGHVLNLEQIGMPLFTLGMGLMDGLNPCSMWVLILMISLLAPMNNRGRMLAVAGTFVVVEGVVYFLFMAAWLNLFLFIGWSRLSEQVIAAIALLAGMVNVKDFWAFGRGISLSIPLAAKPGIYASMRNILQAKNLAGALVGAVVLAVLVQCVEFFCTSGFPALYTHILALKAPDIWGYYGYLLLYNVAYMLDDIIVLAVGVATLSQRRLQEQQGRWLKLSSGVVMLGLGFYLLLRNW